MKKEKTATVAGKTAQKERRIITTDDSKREVEDSKISPPIGHTLQTADLKDGKLSLSNKDFCLRFAQEGDWENFRGWLERRQEKRPQEWRELPSGLKISADKMLLICTNCRRAIWADATAEGTNCHVCNAMNFVKGGKLRRASKKEEEDWFKKETEALARWKANKPRREKEIAEFNRRVRADMGGKP